jgi:uridine kinase
MDNDIFDYYSDNCKHYYQFLDVMCFDQMIKEIARLILEAKRDCPLRVGIDGIDAAGKTWLANALAFELSQAGAVVLRASIDGFHNPRELRYRRGNLSPEGYYSDSFNVELLKESLLEPLEPGGNRRCRLQAFDFKTDSEIRAEAVQATDDSILVFEGVFLFRPELRRYWDFKIFVEIDFETSLQRALKRDLDLFSEPEEIIKRYREKYIPGQKIYLESEKPQSLADVVIDNHDFTKPRIIFRRSPNFTAEHAENAES